MNARQGRRRDPLSDASPARLADDSSPRGKDAGTHFGARGRAAIARYTRSLLVVKARGSTTRRFRDQRQRFRNEQMDFRPGVTIEDCAWRCTCCVQRALGAEPAVLPPVIQFSEPGRPVL